MASILLAFGIEAWWEERGERSTEVILLQEIGAALTSDLGLLEERLERLKRIEDRTDVLHSVIQSGAPYADSLDTYFGSFFETSRLRLNAAGYASLQSQGLGLVSDPSLRSKVAEIYETTYPRLYGAAEGEREVVLNFQRPYLISRFRDYEFGQTATPLDPETLWADPEFLNLLNYRLEVVRQGDIPTYEQGIAEIGDLINMLGEELGLE